MRKSLILIAFALTAIASATEPGGYGVSILTETGCYTASGPGNSAIAIGRGWNNGNLDLPVTVRYTSHEATAHTQEVVESVVDHLRRLLPLVTLVKTTNTTAPMTIRVQSAALPGNMLGQANYPYSVEPIAGDVLIHSGITDPTQLWRVAAHEIAHAMGIGHGGSLMLPYYTPGPLAYEVKDQILFSWWYRITPYRYYTGGYGR